MAKLMMKQVRIVALRSDRKKLLERLQTLGTVEVTSTETACRGFDRIDTTSQTQVFERNSQLASQALGILNKIVPEKKGMLDSLSGRRQIPYGELSGCAAKRSEMMKVCTDIIKYDKQRSDNAAEAVRIKANIAQLEPWKKLDVPFCFEGTRTTAAFIGSVAGTYTYDSLNEAIAESAPGKDFDFEIISVMNGVTCVFVMTPRNDSEDVLKALRTLGFAKPMGANRSLPADKITRLRHRLTELKRSDEDAISEITALADKRQDIEDISDYFAVRAEKYRVIGELDHSKHAFIINGYIPAEDCDRLSKALEEIVDCVIEFSDADGDNVPVKLKNNAFVSPVESMVEMYAMPNAADVDPTPLMAFFFYFFFGMMFSDAGYGLIMIIATTWVLKKFKPEKSISDSMKMFRYCGVFTTLWGFIYASFFGNAITSFSQIFFDKTPDILFLTRPLIDPINDSTTLMVISVAFGLIQILVGIGAKFYILWRQGERFSAVFDCGSWMLMLVGAAVLAAGILLGKTVLYIGTAMMIIAAIALVCTQGRDKKGIMKVISGLASLYDSTSYISDLMSYTRLLALGLTTAIMGNVFNMLSTQFSGSIWMIIPMILVFIIGHCINFGLNALGSYVHSMRLQYVEMFSKFYEGGGKKFKPFALNSKYTRLQEENKQ